MFEGVILLTCSQMRAQLKLIKDHLLPRRTLLRQHLARWIPLTTKEGLALSIHLEPVMRELRHLHEALVKLNDHFDRMGNSQIDRINAELAKLDRLGIGMNSGDVVSLRVSPLMEN